jgi:hypothetical protein
LEQIHFSQDRWRLSSVPCRRTSIIEPIYLAGGLPMDFERRFRRVEFWNMLSDAGPQAGPPMLRLGSWLARREHLTLSRRLALSAELCADQPLVVRSYCGGSRRRWTPTENFNRLFNPSCPHRYRHFRWILAHTNVRSRAFIAGCVFRPARLIW